MVLTTFERELSPNERGFVPFQWIKSIVLRSPERATQTEKILSHSDGSPFGGFRQNVPRVCVVRNNLQ
jgi:hypothetical protein